MTEALDQRQRDLVVRRFDGMVWEEAFGASPSRLRLLARGLEGSVWQVLGRSPSGERKYILKLTRDIRAVCRELAAQERVVGRLALPAPALIGGGACRQGPGGYVLFADDGLRPARPRRVDGMARLLARLHATPLCDLTLPDTAQSHTPAIAEVAKRVDRIARDECAEWLAPFAADERDRRGLLDVLARVQQRSVSVWEETTPVLCHGDSHAGNFMAAPRGGRLRLIDWEFVHVDYPYFDIFQLLDATSPHTALPVFPPRLRALSSYHASAGGGLPLRRRFVEGYLQYAGIHLFWILSLIHEDARQGRHRASRLMRQGRETRRLIGEIGRDWRTVDDG